jgi:hypothetical protein
LHEIHPGGGAGEAVFLGDRDEVFEIPKLHAVMPQIDDNYRISSLDSITTVTHR